MLPERLWGSPILLSDRYGGFFTRLSGRGVKLSTLRLLVTALLRMRGTVPYVLCALRQL